MPLGVARAVIMTRAAAGGPGALPAYDSESTAVTSATLAATHAINYPATVAAGDLLLAVGVGKCNDGNAGIVGHADLLSAGFALLLSDAASNGNVAVAIYWKEAVGNEDGTSITNGFTGSGGTLSDGVRTQMFRFTAANGFAATPYEDAHLHTDADNFDTSIAMPTVTPSGANRRAVCIIATSSTATVAAATGESGGDWALNHSGAANNCGIHAQSSDQSGGGAISGGTAVSTLDALALAVGLALVPGTV